MVIAFRAGIRFPRAANEPPRADALRGLIEAFYPSQAVFWTGGCQFFTIIRE